MKRASLLALATMLSACSVLPSNIPDCPETLQGLDYVGHLDGWPEAGGYWLDNDGDVLAWSPSEDSYPMVMTCRDVHGIFDIQDDN